MAEHNMPPREPEEMPVKEKHLPQTTKTKVILRKPNPLKKLIRRFLADDVEDVQGYLIDELIVPEIKSIIQNYIDFRFWGGGSRKSVIPGPSRRNYNAISTPTTASSRQRRNSANYHDRLDIDEIIFETKKEAADKLDEMKALIEEYKQVTVADLYEIIGETCDYNGNYYGWTDLSGAYVSITRNGYLLNLPRPVYLR